MKTISIRLSEEQHKNLLKQVNQKGVTITEFILNQCNLVNHQKDLTITSVIDLVNKLEKGDEFTIKSLYSYNTWKNFSKASRLSVGRHIYNEVLTQGTLLNRLAKFVCKDSNNTAIYERI